jgi:hypothetical protein
MVHITNFDSDKRGERYAKAAYICGIEAVIKTQAYDMGGNLIPGYQSLWSKGRYDKAQFWKAADSLR